MSYPQELFFDLDSLINVAQPRSILLLGPKSAEFLDNYREQKALLGQDCTITHFTHQELDAFSALQERFEVAIVFDFFEHVDKQQGQQCLARLRDVLSKQYCICLPLAKNNDLEGWKLTDLFAFALNRVAVYSQQNTYYGLFKYNLDEYKKTPDWLNSDNWANPQMWGKYWW